MTPRVLYALTRGTRYRFAVKGREATEAVGEYRGWRNDDGAVTHLFGSGRARVEVADRALAYVVTAS